VKRIAVDALFFHAALGALMKAAREMKGIGTFIFAADASPHA
jgi:hypothetical protein